MRPRGKQLILAPGHLSPLDASTPWSLGVRHGETPVDEREDDVVELPDPDTFLLPDDEP